MLEKNKLEFSTGFESTCFKIGLGTSIKCSDLDKGSCQILPNTYQDVLSTTHHYEFFKKDLQKVKNFGIKIIRYPIPWHLIEAKKDVYDWCWMDKALKEIKRFELQIIADPLHHTSFPTWLSGFDDPLFCNSYRNFVKKFAERYPQVKFYTIFNEPTPTVLFCSHEKVWHPFGEGPASYVSMVKNVAKTICLITEDLKELNSEIKFVHVDTCEYHQALDEISVPFVRFLNERRFLILDLLLGRVDTSYVLWWYLEANGFSNTDLKWFKTHKANVDFLGLDYYSHSEHQYHQNGSFIPALKPLGFKEVATQYYKYFDNIPILLTETNIRGFVTDRISWFKFMLEECNKLIAEGIDLRLFCWFPFIDSTDWDYWVTVPRGIVDPVGILWLDKNRKIRYESEFSKIYSLVNKKQMNHQAIPAYRFQPPLNQEIKGFIEKFMSSWKWKEVSY